MDNSLPAVRVINHKYIVVEGRRWEMKVILKPKKTKNRPTNCGVHKNQIAVAR